MVCNGDVGITTWRAFSIYDIDFGTSLPTSIGTAATAGRVSANKPQYCSWFLRNGIPVASWLWPYVAVLDDASDGGAMVYCAMPAHQLPRMLQSPVLSNLLLEGPNWVGLETNKVF